MQWEFIVALIVAIPVVLVPVAFIWYLNFGGIQRAIQEGRKRKAAYEEGAKAVAEEQPAGAGAVAQERPAERELVGTRR